MGTLTIVDEDDTKITTIKATLNEFLDVLLPSIRNESFLKRFGHDSNSDANERAKPVTIAIVVNVNAIPEMRDLHN